MLCLPVGSKERVLILHCNIQRRVSQSTFSKHRRTSAWLSSVLWGTDIQIQSFLHLQHFAPFSYPVSFVAIFVILKNTSEIKKHYFIKSSFSECDQGWAAFSQKRYLKDWEVSVIMCLLVTWMDQFKIKNVPGTILKSVIYTNWEAKVSDNKPSHLEKQEITRNTEQADKSCPEEIRPIKKVLKIIILKLQFTQNFWFVEPEVGGRFFKQDAHSFIVSFVVTAIRDTEESSLFRNW